MDHLSFDPETDSSSGSLPKRPRLLMWLTDRLSGLFANATTNVLFGDGHAGGGFRPDYKHAYFLIKEKEWDNANREIEEQLAKDPDDFEGRRLLISNHLHLEQPDRALGQAELLEKSRKLTDEQRAWAEAARKQLQGLVQSKPGDGCDRS
jgi:prepilin-type processing-associated H-X9-DG protein